MKTKTLAIFISLFLGLPSLKSQDFISHTQSYYSPKDHEDIYIHKTLRVSLTEDEYWLEWPDGQVLTGDLSLYSDTVLNGEPVKIYVTDKKCPISVFDDHIFVNFYRTHDQYYVYHLDNYVFPTEEEKKKMKEENLKAAEKMEYEANVEMFGDFAADCIKEGVVKEGLREAVVVLIKGEPLRINKMVVRNLEVRQYVYEDMHIYVDNGVVSSIQRFE
jgi:hypothetical protein